MIRITAQVDSEFAKMAGKQLPFITSVALNRTAVGARDVVRGNLPKRFRLKNNWTRGGIQARTSSKTDLKAMVVAPDYMAIQETGGTRKPDSGFKMLSAPAESLQGGGGVIPRSKRPRALLNSGKAFIIGKDGGAGIFVRKGKKIRLLWWLSPDQSYEERFEFERDVNEHVQDRFGSNFVAAFAQAMQGSKGR